MKNRNLIIAVIFLSVIAILSSFDKKETVFLNEEKTVTIKNNETKEEKKFRTRRIHNRSSSRWNASIIWNRSIKGSSNSS